MLHKSRQNENKSRQNEWWWYPNMDHALGGVLSMFYTCLKLTCVNWLACLAAFFIHVLYIIFARTPLTETWLSPSPAFFLTVLTTTMNNYDKIINKPDKHTINKFQQDTAYKINLHICCLIKQRVVW